MERAAVRLPRCRRPRWGSRVDAHVARLLRQMSRSALHSDMDLPGRGGGGGCVSGIKQVKVTYALPELVARRCMA